jgi:hypothetical protein
MKDITKEMVKEGREGWRRCNGDDVPISEM